MFKRRSQLPRINYRSRNDDGFLYYSSVLVTAGLSWICYLVPNFITEKVALVLARVMHAQAVNYRENVASNMSHVLDESPTSPQVDDAVVGVFDNVALNCLDLLKSPHIPDHDLRDSVHLSEGSWQYLDDALSGGNGVIVLTAHLGAFDLVGSALAHYGYPMTFLTMRTTNRFAYNSVSFLRRSHRVNVVEASSGGVRQVIKELRAGKIIGLLSDRDFHQSGVDVKFFGEDTTLPVGAAKLSRDSGAPIVPVFTHRSGRTNDLVIHPPFHIPVTDNRKQDILNGVSLMKTVLEKEIGKYPDQWVLFQRVWPTSVEQQPAAEVDPMLVDIDGHNSSGTIEETRL